MTGEPDSRRITEVYEKKSPLYRTSYDPPKWYVKYQSWDLNGMNKGEWGLIIESQDREGAMLKMLAHWRKLDARKARRRKQK